MSPETLLLSVGLVLAFGGVPLATLIHAHIATMRAARHVAEIEALAASRADPQDRHADGIERLGVLELQALATAAAKELNERREDRSHRELGPRHDHLRDRRRAPSQRLVQAG